jgi:hypothetical protein
MKIRRYWWYSAISIMEKSRFESGNWVSGATFFKTCFFVLSGFGTCPRQFEVRFENAFGIIFSCPAKVK